MTDKSRWYGPTPENAAKTAYEHGDSKTVESIAKSGYDLGKQPWFYPEKKTQRKKVARKKS